MKRDIQIFTPRSSSHHNNKKDNLFSITSLLTPNKITQSIDIKSSIDARSSIEAAIVHNGMEDSHTIKKKAEELTKQGRAADLRISNLQK